MFLQSLDSFLQHAYSDQPVIDLHNAMHPVHVEGPGPSRCGMATGGMLGHDKTSALVSDAGSAVGADAAMVEAAMKTGSSFNRM